VLLGGRAPLEARCRYCPYGFARLVLSRNQKDVDEAWVLRSASWACRARTGGARITLFSCIAKHFGDSLCVTRGGVALRGMPVWLLTRLAPPGPRMWTRPGGAELCELGLQSTRGEQKKHTVELPCKGVGIQFANAVQGISAFYLRKINETMIA